MMSTKATTTSLALCLTLLFSMSTHSSDCKGGYTFSAELNRCVLQNSTVKLQEGYKNLKNSKTATSKDYMENARSESGATGAGESLGDNSKSDITGWGTKESLKAITYSASLFTNINQFSSKEAKGTQCLSGQLLAGVTAAAIVGELGIHYYGKMELDDIEEKLRKDLSGSSYDVQVKAFEALIDEQRSLANLARLKRNYYIGQTALFAAVAGVAAYEVTPWGASGACKWQADPVKNKFPDDIAPDAPNPSDLGTALFSPNLTIHQVAEIDATIGHKGAFEEYLKILATKGFSFFISSAHALPIDPQTGLADISAPVKKGIDNTKKAYKTVKKALQTSWGILGLATAQGTLSGLVANDMQEVVEYYQDNITKLQNTLVAFENSVICKTHDNLSDPTCYCFDDNRKKDPTKTKSATCQVAWKKRDNNLTLASNNYGVTLKGDALGCIDRRTGEYDQTCSCKKVQNKKGENACQKTNINLGSLSASTANSLGVTDGVSLLNALNSGTLGYGNLNTEAVSKSAAKANRAISSLIAKANQERAKTGEPPLALEKLNKGLVAELLSDKTMQNSSVPALTTLAGNVKHPLIEEGLAQAGIKKSEEMTFKKGAKKNTAIKDQSNFFMSDSSGSSASGRSGGEVQNFMDKSYNYKEVEIHKDNDASIFEVISHRYNQSGLKRLLGE